MPQYRLPRKDRHIRAPHPRYQIRQMVQEKASSEEIKAEAVKDGMVTLRQDGINRVLAGGTTYLRS